MMFSEENHMFKQGISRLLTILTLLFACAGFTDAPAAESKPVPAGSSIGKLEFDSVRVSRHTEVIVQIKLPDGGFVTRVVEPLPGRDGKDGGFNRLKGYRLPNGVIVPKDIHRNSDGTLTVMDLNSDHRHPDRNSVRMSEDEFIKWVKAQH